MEQVINKAYQAEPKITKNRILSAFKEMATISEILRVLGTCGVIASMSLFMLAGWSDGNDVSRYLKLLTQTGLLAMAGLAMSFLLKENKSARLFLGLSLVSVVANFTILGALIYSVVQWDNGLAHYPSAMTWRVFELATFWAIGAGAVLFLALVSKFSFAVFSRQTASYLTISFLGLSALLLMPVRSSIAISILVLLSLGIAVKVVRHIMSKEDVLVTPGLKFAFLCLFLPGLIMTARAISLYESNTVIWLSISMAAFVGLRQIMPHLSQHNKFADLLVWCKAGLSLVMACLLMSLLPSSAILWSPLVFSVSLLALTYDNVARTNNERIKSLLVSASGLCVFFYQLGFLLFGNAVIGLLVALMLGVFAKFYRNRFSLFLAGLLVLVSLLTIGKDIALYVDLSNWVTMGVGGALIIIAASVIERYGATLKLQWVQLVNKPNTEQINS